MNPKDDLHRGLYLGGLYLGWHSRPEQRIADTAVVTNTNCEPDGILPVTHYVDQERI